MQETSTGMDLQVERLLTEERYHVIFNQGEQKIEHARLFDMTRMFGLVCHRVHEDDVRLKKAKLREAFFCFAE